MQRPPGRGNGAPHAPRAALYSLLRRGAGDVAVRRHQAPGCCAGAEKTPAFHLPASNPAVSDKAIIVKIVDLSRELYHRTPSYPGHPPVMHGIWKTHEESFVESGNVHGLRRCSSRCPTMPAPTSTRPGISARAASRSTNIRWRSASFPASASTCATSRRAPRSRHPISKRRCRKPGSACPRAAPFCSAPAITSGRSRARNMPPTIPA